MSRKIYCDYYLIQAKTVFINYSQTTGKRLDFLINQIHAGLFSAKTNNYLSVFSAKFNPCPQVTLPKTFQYPKALLRVFSFTFHCVKYL